VSGEAVFVSRRTFENLILLICTLWLFAATDLGAQTWERLQPTGFPENAVHLGGGHQLESVSHKYRLCSVRDQGKRLLGWARWRSGKGCELTSGVEVSSFDFDLAVAVGRWTDKPVKNDPLLAAASGHFVCRESRLKLVSSHPRLGIVVTGEDGSLQSCLLQLSEGSDKAPLQPGKYEVFVLALASSGPTVPGTLPTPLKPSPELPARATPAVTAKDGAAKTTPSAAEAASWIFGGLIVIFLMAIVLFRLRGDGANPIEEPVQKILGLFGAIISGLFAFFFTGAVAANVAPAVGSWGTLGIQATGGAALFVIVLWWWRSERAPIAAAGDRNTLQALGAALSRVDQIYPGIVSVTKSSPEASSEYRVTAKIEADALVFRDKGRSAPVMTITAQEIKKLPSEDRKFIRAHENSMRSLFREWTDLYPRRNTGSSDEIAHTNERLKAIALEICRDLNRIFDHLDYIGRELEDHYAAMRSICESVGGSGG